MKTTIDCCLKWHRLLQIVMIVKEGNCTLDTQLLLLFELWSGTCISTLNYDKSTRNRGNFDKTLYKCNYRSRPHVFSRVTKNEFIEK